MSRYGIAMLCTGILMLVVAAVFVMHARETGDLPTRTGRWLLIVGAPVFGLVMLIAATAVLLVHTG